MFLARVYLVLYNSSSANPVQLANDQWTSRYLTESPDVPLVELSRVHVASIQECFDSELDAELPWSLNIPDFQPELNYHLEVVAKVSHEDATITTNQAKSLLKPDLDPMSKAQSLLNPDSMYFFYDKAK